MGSHPKNLRKITPAGHRVTSVSPLLVPLMDDTWDTTADGRYMGSSTLLVLGEFTASSVPSA